MLIYKYLTQYRMTVKPCESVPVWVSCSGRSGLFIYGVWAGGRTVAGNRFDTLVHGSKAGDELYAIRSPIATRYITTAEQHRTYRTCTVPVPPWQGLLDNTHHNKWTSCTLSTCWDIEKLFIIFNPT